MRRWLKDETDFIAANLYTMNNIEMARHLGVEVSSLKQKKARMKKELELPETIDKNLDKIINYLKNETVEDVATRLLVSSKKLKKELEKRNIEFTQKIKIKACGYATKETELNKPPIIRPQLSVGDKIKVGNKANVNGEIIEIMRFGYLVQTANYRTTVAFAF